MAAEAEGSGFGKLILFGEHAVVHGSPAIAVAVQRRLRVALRRREGPTDLAPGTWGDDRVRAVLRQVLPDTGVEVRIYSELPTGRGMGSSAALAVALIRGASLLADENPSSDTVFEKAFDIERVFHGNPSGVDQAVSARGGALWYRRGPPRVLEPLPPPTWPIVVLDSGVAGNTAELVAGVTARRPGIDRALTRIAELVETARHLLNDAAALGPLLDENHALLREIGVSTPLLDDLVTLARAAGAYGAKLSGAGGGGVVIALAPEPERVLAVAKTAGVSAFVTRVAEPA